MTSELFQLEHLFTLLMLILLQAVLGFDNLLYISLESKKAPLEKQRSVRIKGIGIAIFLRILLLFSLVSLIKYFQKPFLSMDETFLKFDFNVHSLIVLFGGGFIMYTAIKEIWHMISHEQISDNDDEHTPKSAKAVITTIIIMNIVFSFDSILSAMALTNHIGNETIEFILMVIAIIISGFLMMFLADKISVFLQKNRLYEVLGLFILFIVGVMLLTEGGHIGELTILGEKIEPMPKTTFYFIIAILILVDLVQSKYQKRIIEAEKKEELKDNNNTNV